MNRTLRKISHAVIVLYYFMSMPVSLNCEFVTDNNTTAYRKMHCIMQPYRYANAMQTTKFKVSKCINTMIAVLFYDFIQSCKFVCYCIPQIKFMLSSSSLFNTKNLYLFETHVTNALII